MRLVGEKFLRTCDTAAVYYIKKDGPAVTYLNKKGKETAVDESTGGLLLDNNGRTQLNPYYSLICDYGGNVTFSDVFSSSLPGLAVSGLSATSPPLPLPYINYPKITLIISKIYIYDEVL
jgi:hypothetical protein